MKKIILVLIICLIPITTHAFEVKLLGGQDIWQSVKPMSVKWWAGNTASVATHEMGHLLVLEHRNLDYTFKNGMFRYYPESANDQRIVGRSGFYAQFTGRLALSAIPNLNKEFKDGYDFGTLFLIGSYSARRGWDRGDLSAMSKGEYLGWAAVALGMNIIEIKW